MRRLIMSSACVMACVAAVTCKSGDEGQGDDGESYDGPITGIADLHLHMFAEAGFGGGWFHGTVLGDGATALGPCDGGQPGDHGRLRDDLASLLEVCEDVDLEQVKSDVPLFGAVTSAGGGFVSEVIASIPGSSGDTGSHLDRRS